MLAVSCLCSLSLALPYSLFLSLPPLSISQLDNGCSLHLAQRWSQLLNIQLRRIPILSKESAPGLIMATGGPHDRLSALWLNTSRMCKKEEILAPQCLCSCCSALLCSALINRVHIGPFRECGTHCNDREQVHEPDYLSSCLAKNIDFCPLCTVWKALPPSCIPLSPSASHRQTFN